MQSYPKLIHTFLTYFCIVSFNVNLQCIPQSLKCSLLITYSDQISVMHPIPNLKD